MSISNAAAGYSGTPLSAKLGLKPGCELFALESPPGYAQLLEPWPEGLRFTFVHARSMKTPLLPPVRVS